MNEYTWKLGDSLSGQKLPKKSFPKRIALTATAVIIKTKDEGSLLLCNPHPESWNNWQMPYGSLALEAPSLPPGITFNQLAQSIEQLKTKNAEKYETDALGQIRSMLGWSSFKFVTLPKLCNFSLKYSKTANTWTAYSFEYHLCRDLENIKSELQVTWVSLDSKSLQRLATSSTFEGHAVADNVLALLETPALIKESLAT